MSEPSWSNLISRDERIGNLLAAVRAYRGDDAERFFWHPLHGISERLSRVIDALEWPDPSARDDAYDMARATLWHALPGRKELPVPWIAAAPDAVHLFASSDLRRLLHAERTDANQATMLAVHDAACRLAGRGGADAALAMALAWFAASIRDRDDAATKAAAVAIVAALDAMPPEAIVAHKRTCPQTPKNGPETGDRSG